MRVIVLFFTFVFLLFSAEIKTVEILKDAPHLNFETIKSAEGFKKTTEVIERETTDSFWFRITFDRDSFDKNKKYVLKGYSQFNQNSMLFQESAKVYYRESAIDLVEDDLERVYVKFQNRDDSLYLYFKVYEKETFQDRVYFKNIIFGITYGIIFSAFLYYLAFYIFNRQKSFIYYALTQLSMLILLATDDPIEELAILGFLVFSNLFTKEFLNTKKHAPFLDKVLTFMIFFFIFESFSEVIYDGNVHKTILLPIYIITAGVIYYKTRFKPILFYMLGWGAFVTVIMFITLQRFFIDSFAPAFNVEFLIQSIASFESLVLAFSLSYKMKLLEEEKLSAERMFIHQNKLAAMGEMISNISHQWRQPLTHLGYIIMNINTAFKHNQLDKTYLEKKSNEATTQLEYMSNTIEDFKNFYMPQKDKGEFSVKESIKNALAIINPALDSLKIEIEVRGEDFIINGLRSEFLQVILNLISNAKDVLTDRSIENPKIVIQLLDNKISVEDNAGGIEKQIEEKIFEPYITTKKEGSGLGLYMSKTIIETHFNGQLTFTKTDKGTSFNVLLD